jgi:hypothetical protein
MIRKSIGRPVALVVLFLALVLPARVSAQGFDPEAMRQRMTDQVAETVKTLALEGEVADKVHEILMARVEKRMELFAEMRAAREQGRQGGFQGMRDKMASQDEETGKQLAEVLTEEQLAAWKAHEEELRSRMRRGPRNG